MLIHMRSKILAITLSALCLSLLEATAARTRTLHVVTTGDVHGAWFDRPYVKGHTRTSLASVSAYLKELRAGVGEDNVLLIDAGDCLQGDNAPYYFNYVDTASPHLFPLIASYLGYDAVIVGNHDIETGHQVYDRVRDQLEALGIPFLAANAVRPDGTPYFKPYTIVRKAGLKVAVVGFTNANIKEWLGEDLWSGMDFSDLLPCVQNTVDEVISLERPDVVIAVVHSGTGDGDGSVLESQGLDLQKSLKGVDLLVCAHDHRPAVEPSSDGPLLLNGGSRAGYVGSAQISVSTRLGRVTAKSVEGTVVKLDKDAVDPDFDAAFAQQYDDVKAFTLQPVGALGMPLRTREAYAGMSDYLNLIHTVQLVSTHSDISFAAPLTFDGYVREGVLIYDDMFTIYPYENQLFVLELTGAEIKSYLEFSYDRWIVTAGEHLLRISRHPDARTNSPRWSFDERSYNFDSAAGICYEVDVTKPCGQRISIGNLADGRPFDESATYRVAMTSYRANGGGSLLKLGAGLDKAQADSRIVARFPEIRELVYRYVSARPCVNADEVGEESVIGRWSFVPRELARPLLEQDLDLLFPPR